MTWHTIGNLGAVSGAWNVGNLLLPKIVNMGGRQFIFDHDLFCVVQNDKTALERLLEPVSYAFYPLRHWFQVVLQKIGFGI
jgi:hypothetical protein